MGAAVASFSSSGKITLERPWKETQLMLCTSILLRFQNLPLTLRLDFLL